MVPKEWALILTSVARVMETMSSWERSWVGVPVRWGSCRGGGDAAEEEEEQERQRHQNRHQHNRRESSTPCRERGREREGRKKGAIARRRAAVTYSRGEPLHQAAYQARIAVHCAVTRAGLDRRLLMIVLLCRFAVVSGFPFPVSISVSVSVRSSAAAAGAARRTLGFFFFLFFSLARGCVHREAGPAADVGGGGAGARAGVDVGAAGGGGAAQWWLWRWDCAGVLRASCVGRSVGRYVDWFVGSLAGSRQFRFCASDSQDGTGGRVQRVCCVWQILESGTH